MLSIHTVYKHYLLDTVLSTVEKKEDSDFLSKET